MGERERGKSEEERKLERWEVKKVAGKMKDEKAMGG